MGLKPIYLGIDLGTSTIEGQVMADDGRVLATFLKETPLISRQIIRAIIEGVSFSMRECLEVFRTLKLPVNKVILSGGGAQNPVWRQILSNVLYLTIKIINIQDPHEKMFWFTKNYFLTIKI